MNLESQAQIIKEFENFCSFVPKMEVLASDQTTFRIGGKLGYLIEPNTETELSRAITWLKSSKVNFRILGAGSNLLVDSNGINDWIIRLGRGFSYVEKLEQDCFRIGAGYSLSRLSRELSRDGYSGLEFAAGIPASLGGAIRMNAGAHKGEMASVFKSLEAYDNNGKKYRFEGKDINFSYRHTTLAKDLIITAIEIKLTPSYGDEVSKLLNHNLEYRKKTQPLSLPSAGSIFRNPGLDSLSSAGAIIEKLGLKGFRVGNAEISNLHANWIVNPFKNALSSDVIALINLCKEKASKELSIELQTEIVIW